MGHDLPQPRQDGLCADCARKPAVTTDGRFCRPCLRRHIGHITPMVGCFRKRGDTDSRQGRRGEISPWQENNIRRLEGD